MAQMCYMVFICVFLRSASSIWTALTEKGVAESSVIKPTQKTTPKFILLPSSNIPLYLDETSDARDCHMTIAYDVNNAS